MLEKADVKDGEYQPNVPIVAHTLGHLEPARIAQRPFVRHTHPAVQDAMLHRRSLPTLARVIHVPRRHLQLAHAHNLLLGEHPKLDVLDALLCILRYELLHRAAQRG